MLLDEAQVRREKLAKLKALGMAPYPVDPRRGVLCEEALASFDAWSAEGRAVTLAGRLLTIRVHGGMMFADLVDATGRLQVAFKLDEIGEEVFGQFRDLVDPGDIVEATGTLFTTKRGEKSLNVTQWRMLSKALLPLPEKWHGLQDVERRYRERELDLIANQDVRKKFIVRSKLVSAMRAFLDARGFLEVETPMLHPIAGGANARPFVTHHNALDVDLYLRIAPELYLKRLLVGGFEKVYEVARCFRNEGIDYAHNPEFTQIELYWAYVEKQAYLRFIEEMVETMVREAMGSLEVPHESGTINFAGPWPTVTFREAVLEACGIDIDELASKEDVEKVAMGKKLKIDFSACVGLGEALDELYKKTARTKITQPTWVLDYPVELKPLANRKPEDPRKSATAQLVIQGAEIVNAYYHELNDPIDQRRRFEEQQALREAGSEEAQPMDEAFLRALEHAMPPAGGMGMGIDRLVAFVTGSHSLKEVILFPTLRPEAADAPPAE
jgi:lysyl-tRNA synthetase class 2